MQFSFFDLENRYEQLSKLRDPLEELNRMIDWNLFADLLRETTTKPRKSAAGRKPFDRVMLFKMLVLQRMHNLSEDRLEYQVRDRLSFMRFLGLDLAGVVPDAKTMWAFREELKENQLIERLFARFAECLRELDVELKSGQIIDATFVTVPKQRNTREENKIIKEGAIPIEWGQNPHKLAQKDIDARWTKKNNESFYGYKDHVNVDQCTKLITHGNLHQRKFTIARFWQKCCNPLKREGLMFTRIQPIAAKHRKKFWLLLDTRAAFTKKVLAIIHSRTRKSLATKRNHRCAHGLNMYLVR